MTFKLRVSCYEETDSPVWPGAYLNHRYDMELQSSQSNNQYSTHTIYFVGGSVVDVSYGIQVELGNVAVFTVFQF